MQRTVKFTEVHYVDVTENGELKQCVENVIEKDPKKAIKMLTKKLGHTVTVLSCVEKEKLYKLDDEIFFQYAVEVTE